MSGVMKNSAIAAKLKCMRAKMLTFDDYRQMASADSVAAAASYLKNNTVYSTYLENVSESQIHRGNLELILNTALLEDFEKLYCFANSGLKEFLSKILMFHEAEAINKVARSIYTHSSANDELSGFLKRHIDVDIGLLSKASDLDKFVESLVNTQYYSALVHVARNRENLTAYDIETALNIYCYMSVAKYISGKMAKEERETAREFYGTMIDLCNLRILYRCINNFHLESDYIYSYIIPFSYKIKKEDIVKIANTKTADEFAASISHTPYAKIFENNFFEKNAARFMCGLSKRFLKMYPYSYVSLSSFFKIKEIEISNIFSVIEGVRYQLEPQEILYFTVV